MGLTATLSEPLYVGSEGSTTSAEVPSLFDVAIGGHPYMIDTKRDWGHITLPLIRQQADNSLQPSEVSISPEELWRRSAESLHRGAGQEIRDLPGSDPHRFNTSKGIDPWTRWQITLLPSTDQKLSSANTNLDLAVVGDYLYVADGTDVKFTDDITVDSPTFTTMTGLSGSSILSITSDGQYVYITDGADIYRSTAGTTAAGTAWNTLDAELLGYVKGRLMAADGASVYNITSASAPAALFTHNNSSWEWVGFAPGSNHIYMAGFVGDKSLIYRTQVKADATALDAPVVAGELPDGEIVRSIGGYLGFILLGTDKGVRFCGVDDNGDLVVGELVGPSKAVRCFEGQDRFVRFGWSNYDSTDTGLGRLDLREFLTDDFGNQLLAPAYASDLMATVQGDVLDVVTFDALTVFAVSGQGIYAEHTDKVSSGTIDLGAWTFGMPADPKVAMYVDLRHEPLDGEVNVWMATDGGSFDSLGVSATADSTRPTSMTADNTKGELFEMRLVLERDGTDATAAPVVTRLTLRAFPAPARGSDFLVPVLLHEVVTTRDNQDRNLDPEAELAYLEGLSRDGDLVSYQYGHRSETVKVESVEWAPHEPTHNETLKFWNGTAVLRLRRYSQGE